MIIMIIIMIKIMIVIKLITIKKITIIIIRGRIWNVHTFPIKIVKHKHPLVKLH